MNWIGFTLFLIGAGAAEVQLPLRASGNEKARPLIDAEELCMCICRESRRPLLENRSDKALNSLPLSPLLLQMAIGKESQAKFCEQLCGNILLDEFNSEQLKHAEETSPGMLTNNEAATNSGGELGPSATSEAPKYRQKRNTYARYYGGPYGYGYGYGMYDPYYYSPFFYY